MEEFKAKHKQYSDIDNTPCNLLSAYGIWNLDQENIDRRLFRWIM